MTWRHRASKGRAVIHVTSKDTYLIPKFMVVFTVVRKGTCQESTEFDCGSEHCIDSRLVCNSHVNCLDGSDELNCVRSVTHSHEAPETEDVAADAESASVEKQHEEVPYHPIILGSIGLAFVALTAACCCVTIRRRLRDGRRRRDTSLEPSQLAQVDADLQQQQQRHQLFEDNVRPIQTVLGGDENQHCSLPPPPPPPPPPPCQNGLLRSSIAQYSNSNHAVGASSPSLEVDAEKFLHSRSRTSPIVDVLAAEASALRSSHLVAGVTGRHQGQQRRSRRIRLVFQA
ncbi:hypothetical protein BOX15_Mlig010119g1 [Macrostomum lignano]|uniref:Low-density lipoprotein receptor domain class A n=1 Tax=Macrostomum lignano TaxID=282301 RepID=A0A267DEW7_9PLAT|nr:hypothetical protein BOX15_Mlig010119g1 [Macrostomum lignano]